MSLKLQNVAFVQNYVNNHSKGGFVMDKDLIFHPAYYIKETMEDFELNVYDLADAMCYNGVSLDEIREVLSEKASVTEKFAFALEDTFGISKETWLNLQKNYDCELRK